MFSTKNRFEKKTIKLIGHRVRFRDVMGQSYPVYAAYTRANHARYSSAHDTFCAGSWMHSFGKKLAPCKSFVSCSLCFAGLRNVGRLRVLETCYES